MSLDLRYLLPALLLTGFLASAVWTDVASRRIPNKLILCGTAVGLLLQGILTPGSGLFSDPFGAVGIQQGVGGMALGLLMLLPMYALGAMGAGDVKLMAMIGSFLGPIDTLGAGLTSMVIGGVLSLAVALATGTLISVVSNVKQIVLGSVLRAVAGADPRVEATVVRTGKLPYAVAIAGGTSVYLVLTRALNLSLLN